MMLKFGMYLKTNEMERLLFNVSDLLNGIIDVTNIDEEEIVKKYFGFTSSGTTLQDSK